MNDVSSDIFLDFGDFCPFFIFIFASFSLFSAHGMS